MLYSLFGEKIKNALEHFNYLGLFVLTPRKTTKLIIAACARKLFFYILIQLSFEYVKQIVHRIL